MPSSRGSSQPRDQTQISRTAGDSSPTEPPDLYININFKKTIRKVDKDVNGHLQKREME